MNIYIKIDSNWLYWHEWYQPLLPKAKHTEIQLNYNTITFNYLHYFLFNYSPSLSEIDENVYISEKMKTDR